MKTQLQADIAEQTSMTTVVATDTILEQHTKLVSMLGCLIESIEAETTIVKGSQLAQDIFMANELLDSIDS